MLLIGSSPRARGTADESPVMAQAPVRFIPARAGNTMNRHRCARRQPVHPRARGEHEDGGRAGPSVPVHPRARGEHLVPK